MSITAKDLSRIRATAVEKKEKIATAKVIPEPTKKPANDKTRLKKADTIKLAKADLVKTYRGAALGWMWAIIKPAVTIFVYWFAFTIGLRAGKSVNGFPYFLWIIAGVVPWFYISEMITGGTECIRKYSYLVTKMKFPVATIPTFINISKFAIHAMLIAIVIIILSI